MASDDVQICRICLSEDQQPPAQLVPIFSQLGETLIANILVECTSVQILEDDGLPDVICTECVEDLRFVVGFVEKTRNSDRMLRKMLKGETKPGLFALEVEFVTEQEEAADNDDDVEVKSEVESVDNPQEEDEEEDEDENGQDEEMELQEEPAFVEVDDSDYSVSDHDESDPEQEVDDSLEQSPIRKKARRKPKLVVENEDDYEETIPITELDVIEKEIFTIEEVEDQRVCCTCLKFFNSVKDLKLHSKKVHEPTRKNNAAKKHVCQYCYRRYSSKEALKTHQVKSKLIQQVYVCRKCDARFLDGQKRRTHAHSHALSLASKHGEDNQTWICCAQGCNQAFESEELLQSHSATAHKANKVQSELNNSQHRPVECPICFKRFTNENGLRAHQQRVYQPKKHVCTFCGMKFLLAIDCSRHERQHRDERIFKCEQCSKSYFSEDRLKAHVKRHSATRSFMCNICGQSYLQNHNLQAHMLLHEGKLPFECEICKKGFRVKAKMIYHMRVHSGEKPYPCRYCDSAFADSTNRVRHEMSHTGIKPYKCDSCDKTFITKRLKKEHENTHHETRLYQCSECLDTFSKLSNYKAHMAKHHAKRDDEDDIQILLQ